MRVIEERLISFRRFFDQSALFLWACGLALIVVIVLTAAFA